MNNHSRHKLWVLSMVKPLFRQELISLLEKSNEEKDLIYCFIAMKSILICTPRCFLKYFRSIMIIKVPNLTPVKI
jgi:hypothetical protein